ncbi:MAG TPA: ATP-binding protein [Acidobacteriaceae bacterium]|nr:ATP-binding protein [Acidobacteriaceae bacterium]
MPESCSLCGGSGLKLNLRPNGERYAEDCDCKVRLRASRMLQRAGIPKRYEHCILESFEIYNQADPSLRRAHMMARNFVAGYPVSTEGRGLLLTGNMGVGKTHLAVGILQALILERGVRGLFCDYRELLKRIQESYNPRVATTELQILAPVFEAEVLVLDELGAQKPTDWVWDTVALLLNTRYNDKRTTLITTNYPNLPAAAARAERERPRAAASQDTERAMREESLGDRIGERMRSRLSEMCVEVEMRGEDLRQSVKKARFG